MSLPVSEQSGEPMASTRIAAGSRRTRAVFCRADLVIVMLLSTIVLAAACGGGPSVRLATGPHIHGIPNRALAFVQCMRTHGEPNMPNPVRQGRSVTIAIHPGSGVNPGSEQFKAAFKACRHLASFGKGGAAGEPTISPADQADYLKAVACMRSHGFPKFPDPVFQGNNVTFNSTTPINTNTPQYQRAVATCDKLIPAGLPDSGRTAQ